MKLPGVIGRVCRAAPLTLAWIAFSGCTVLEAPPVSGLTTAEKMMWSTYPLATPKGLATCIIVNRPDRFSPHHIVPVLVTSAHFVAAAPEGPFYLGVRTPEPARNPMVGVLEFQGPERGSRPFFKHPNYDVAVVELRIPLEVAGQIELPSFIDEESIAPLGPEARAGEDICVLGFPRVFPGTEGAFPVLRGGRVASYSPGSPSDQERFLINASVYGGDSGGPVFSGSRRGKPKLLGIVTERIGKKGGNIPLAVALNASVIRETLRLEARHEQLVAGERTRRPSSSRKFTARQRTAHPRLAAKWLKGGDRNLFVPAWP
jgi:Trypsin-like peptidase domain